MFSVRRIAVSSRHWLSPWEESGGRSAALVFLIAAGMFLGAWLAGHRPWPGILSPLGRLLPTGGDTTAIAAGLSAIAVVLYITRSATGRHRKRIELELERLSLTQHYEALIEELPGVAYRATPEARELLFVSPQVMEVTGFSQEEWVADRGLWLRQIHPDDLEGACAAVARVRTSNQPVELLYRMSRKDGSIFWCRERVVMVRNAAGEPQFVSGVFFDVTEQQDARLRLELMNSVVLNLRDAIAIAAPNLEEPVKSTICFVNDALVRQSGYTPEECLGRPVSILYGVDIDSPAAEAIGNTIRTKRPASYECRCQRKDGSFYWVEIGLFPLVNDRGNLTHVVGIRHDITGRRQMEAALRSSEALLRGITGAVPALIWQGSATGRCSFVNKRYEEFTGLSSECCDSYGWMDAVHVNDRVRVLTATNSPEGEEFAFEYRLRRADGQYRWMLAKARAQNRDGPAESVIVSSVDITERKEMEEDLRRSQAALRSSQEAMDRMNRELRQLSGELLRSQDEERRRLARELHDSVGQNLVGLQLILAAANESSGPSAQATELVDQSLREIRAISYLLHPPLLDQLGLVSALRAYVDGFSRRAGIEVECRVPEEFGRLERDTETALFRIVQEGLGNVRKHSGSASAHLTLMRTDDAVVLTIGDRGCGIPAEVMRPGGGGVGLASMRQRAAQLGGRMDVETGPGGTTLTVRLPMSPAAESRSARAYPA
jgi:PAS domain S-box-containing protein